jgi:DNA-binding transcriptional MerR regulator
MRYTQSVAVTRLSYLTIKATTQKNSNMKGTKPMKELDFLKKGNLVGITEFAKFIGTTPKVLRYYHETGLFIPKEHGVKYKNEYRYYSMTQVTEYNLVRVLTQIGVKIADIKSYMENRTPEKLAKLYKRQDDFITNELSFYQECSALIKTQLGLLTDGLYATEEEITVKDMPARQIILGGENNFCNSAGGFVGEFARFCNAEHDPKINLSYSIGGYWDGMDVFMHQPALPIRFFSYDPRGKQQIPEGKYLIGYTRGYYGQTNDLPERMAAFAEENGYLFNDGVYNIYLYDEVSVSDTKQYLLQVCASVREIHHDADTQYVRPRKKTKLE